MKSSISDIMKILEYIQSKGKCKKTEVENIFGNEEVEEFDKYARRGVGMPLVILNQEEYYLPKEGVIALHNFKVEQSQLNFNRWLMIFTGILAIATVFLAIGVFR